MFYRCPAASAILGSLALAVTTGLAAPPSAQASMIQKLYPESGGATTDANGSARGTYFTPQQTFISQGAGVNAHLYEGRSYDFQIYADTDSNSATADDSTLLFTDTFTGSTDGTVRWNDSSFTTPYTFVANTDYVLLFRTTDSSKKLPFNSFLPLFDTAVTGDFSPGDVVVKTGRSNRDATSTNSYIPQLRLLVPEPASAIIMAAGLGACLLRRRDSHPSTK